ncbi:MAG TPA: sodium:calcium antiporter, partial [Gammaproteobacteria bacterium]|nr:sodium:calcium antiporter [Gammaproteobacteria bacterium]
MSASIPMMLAALVVVFLAAELFTNALEHVGERLQVSEGVTGSLFAAIATAMPETIVPILAIFAGTENQQINEEIGVGAILGAPLMLSTLTLFLLAVATIKQRRAQGLFTPEQSGIKRDLDFFLFAFALAGMALLIPHHYSLVRIGIGATLVLSYFLYVLLTIRASSALVQEGHGTSAGEQLYLERIGLPGNLVMTALQLLTGLALLILGAEGFIHGVQIASHALGVSALLLSLLIVPIATELPEKVNSILWIRQSRDTLAFGNITGAMVFQGTLLPAIGITLTAWAPRPEVAAG